MKVGIAIPCFNAAETIAETLRSVQLCIGLDAVARVAIVDDCSTDKSASVARDSWNCPTPLIIHTFAQNQGQWPATNYGLEVLTSDCDWTLLLHADDVVKPNWLTLHFEAICNAAEDVATVCTSYDVWFSNSGRIIPGEEKPGQSVVHVQGGRPEVRDALARGCWWHISGCAIRGSAFKKVGPFNGTFPMLGDWEWMLRMLARGYGIDYLPRSPMHYRQLESSVSSKSFRIGQDLIDRIEILRRYCLREFITPAEYRAMMRRTLRLSLRRLAKGTLIMDGLRIRSYSQLIPRIAGEALIGPR